jgi:ketosteroid isomerase-like protein
MTAGRNGFSTQFVLFCGLGISMSESTIRPIVEAFYRASAERDIERVAAILADDVDWLVQGPVDVFSFLGQRNGKEAVLDGYREIPRKLDVTGYELEALLVDGDRAAALIRLTATVVRTGHVMSFRTSQFSRFRDGKLVEMHAVLDTFDLVEQTIGRPLDVLSPDIDMVSAA